MAEEGSTPVTHAVHQALPTGHAPTADNALLAEVRVQHVLVDGI